MKTKVSFNALVLAPPECRLFKDLFKAFFSKILPIIRTEVENGRQGFKGGFGSGASKTGSRDIHPGRYRIQTTSFQIYPALKPGISASFNSMVK
jgi:hypothetical protein